MSTRALIALPVGKCKALPNGGFIACWNWYDAYPNQLGYRLRTSFNTTVKVQALIELRSFGSICTEEEKNEHIAWAQQNTPNSLSDLNFVKLDFPRSKGLYVYQPKRMLGSLDNLQYYYPDIQAMVEQDVNYVYVFYPNLNKWKMYKYNAHK